MHEAKEWPNLTSYMIRISTVYQDAGNKDEGVRYIGIFVIEEGFIQKRGQRLSPFVWGRT